MRGEEYEADHHRQDDETRRQEQTGGRLAESNRNGAASDPDLLEDPVPREAKVVVEEGDIDPQKSYQPG
ncbi:hypothetical protein ACFC8N_46320 [Streptomyces sp. NPDC055966]|uniref:hypothetical protein n=1 Tax=Streptomyces sp. NPDC055966 TaxID=3345669 RepID=UPI0035DA059D